jgi:hypothetical protein
MDAYRDWIADLIGRGNARRNKLIGLLALAHDRGCEAELADAIAAQLAEGGLLDLAELRLPTVGGLWQ